MALACVSQTLEKSFLRIFETKAVETITHRCCECILIRHWNRQEVDDGPFPLVWIQIFITIEYIITIGYELLETERRNRSC